MIQLITVACGTVTVLVWICNETLVPASLFMSRSVVCKLLLDAVTVGFLYAAARLTVCWWLSRTFVTVVASLSASIWVPLTSFWILYLVPSATSFAFSGPWHPWLSLSAVVWANLVKAVLLIDGSSSAWAFWPAKMEVVHCQGFCLFSTWVSPCLKSWLIPKALPLTFKTFLSSSTKVYWRSLNCWMSFLFAALTVWSETSTPRTSVLGKKWSR